QPPGFLRLQIYQLSEFSRIARSHHHPRWLVEDLRHDRLAVGLRHLAEAAGRACEEAHHCRSFLRQLGGPDGGTCRGDGAERRHGRQWGEATNRKRDCRCLVYLTWL